jgi:hypothetical protein
LATRFEAMPWPIMPTPMNPIFGCSDIPVTPLSVPQ